MRVEDALRRLLAGTQLRAAQTGPMAWRIVAGPGRHASPKPSRRTKPPAQTTLPPPPDELPLQEIIVTATKLSSPVQTTPLSVIMLSGTDLISLAALPGTQAVAALSDGMVLTNLGPGRNRSFIRGVADSPFNGATQSTVAVELDDARVTFNAPDPDLTLVDVERVELLEGPQGPLHGTGALGGVYRIVPKAPVLDQIAGELVVGAELSGGSGPGWNGNAMLNLPLVDGRLALRAVAYAARNAGWIDRSGPFGRNSNSSRVLGGRADIRWVPLEGWTADLAGAVQLLDVDDSQYATSLTRPYQRAGTIAEPHDNDFLNGRLTVRGQLGTADLVSVTSLTSHEVASVLDATASGAFFGLNGPLRFEDDRIYRLFNQEIRLSGGTEFRWLVGASYLSANTTLLAELQPAVGAAVSVGELNQTNSEAAIFANFSAPITSAVRAEAGLRLFRALSNDERTENSGTAARKTRRTGVSPSLSVSWTPDELHFLYLRYSSAFRPAGLSPFAPTADAEFESDELKSWELGDRWRSRDGHWTANATGYLANWDHIQSDYLLPNGLVATRNSGTGQIYGAEVRLGWNDTIWQLSGGFDLQHARLEVPEPGLALPPDSALPIVPKYKAHVMAHRTLDLGTGILQLGARANWIGPTRLSLDPLLNRRIGARMAVDVDCSYASDDWTISAGIANLLGSDADTFSFGNSFSIGSMDQRTPMQPRTFRIGIRKNW